MHKAQRWHVYFEKVLMSIIIVRKLSLPQRRNTMDLPSSQPTLCLQRATWRLDDRRTTGCSTPTHFLTRQGQRLRVPATRQHKHRRNYHNNINRPSFPAKTTVWFAEKREQQRKATALASPAGFGWEPVGELLFVSEIIFSCCPRARGTPRRAGRGRLDVGEP